MNWNLVKDKNTTNELPLCYKSGEWDGLQSDLVLCQDINEDYHLAVCYEGTMDGGYFFDWYNKNDYEIADITQWVKLD